MNEITVTESAANELILQASPAETVVVTETDQNTNTITVSSEPNAVVVTHSTAPDQLMVTHGGSLYRTAVEGGFVGTEVEWLTEILDSKASMSYITEAFASAEQAWASDIMTLQAHVGDNYATLTELNQVYVDEEQARATLATNLTANFQSEITAVNNSLSEAISNETQARAIERQELETQFENTYASNTQLSEAISTATQAFSQDLSILQTNIENNYATQTSLSQAIANESEARTSAINTARSEIDDGVSAELTTFSNTLANEEQARIQMGQQLNTNFTDGINSLITRVDTVESDAISAIATSEQTLRAEFNSDLNNLSTALNAQISTVETNADIALSSVESSLEADILGLGTAVNDRIDSVEVTVGGNVNSISAVQGQINDPINNNSALYGFVQQAQSTADGNTSALTTLGNRVDANEEFAQAQLTLNSEFDSELGTLSARAALETNVNGRVTGIRIGDDGQEQRIEFQSGAVAFLDNNGNEKIFFDTINNQHFFEGTINASQIIGSSVSGISGDFHEMDIDPDGFLRTGVASDGPRVVMWGATRGPYAIWVGEGNATDANAVFYIKKDGQSYFIDKDKFDITDGEKTISEFNSVSHSTNFPVTASVTHEKKGNPVDLRGTVTYSMLVDGIHNNTQPTLTCLIRRGGTTIASRTMPMSVQIIEVDQNTFQTAIFGTLTLEERDTSTSTGNTGYSCTLQRSGTPAGSASNSATIRTEEKY